MSSCWRISSDGLSLLISFPPPNGGKHSGKKWIGTGRLLKWSPYKELKQEQMFGTFVIAMHRMSHLGLIATDSVCRLGECNEEQ